MKQLTTLLASLGLSALLLVGSGFSVHKHYCSGGLKKVSVNHTAPSCHESAAVMSCHRTSESPSCHAPITPADDCCNDQVTWNHTDQYAFSVTGAFSPQAFQVLLVYASKALPEGQHTVAPVAYLHYQPPLLHDSLQSSRLQVFRL